MKEKSLEWGVQQPAQSPDFNICDLAFFPAR